MALVYAFVCIFVLNVLYTRCHFPFKYRQSFVLLCVWPFCEDRKDVWVRWRRFLTAVGRKLLRGVNWFCGIWFPRSPRNGEFMHGRRAARRGKEAGDILFYAALASSSSVSWVASIRVLTSSAPVRLPVRAALARGGTNIGPARGHPGG